MRKRYGNTLPTKIDEVHPRPEDHRKDPLRAQPRSQGLSSLPPLSFSTTMEAEKRDPGNEVVACLLSGTQASVISSPRDVLFAITWRNADY